MSSEVEDNGLCNVPTITKESYDIATATVHNCMSRLIGRVLNTVEGIGLQEKQEEAVKRAIKEHMKDTRRDILEGFYDNLPSSEKTFSNNLAWDDGGTIENA